MTVSHRVPTLVAAGDTIEFLVAAPSDVQTWTPSARLNGPSQMSATSVALEGSDFHVKFSGQATGEAGTYKTAQLIPGLYTCSVVATQGSDRKVITRFAITIAADPTGDAPSQPHAVVMLGLIEAAMQARASGGAIEQYNVDGTDVRKASMEELERLRNKYAAEVAALTAGGQIGRVKFAMAGNGSILGVRRRGC